MIYLATKYSGEEEEAFDRANRTMAALMNKGIHVISPISMCHPPAMDYDLPTDFEYWQQLNRDLIDRCDKVYVIVSQGWESSTGVKGEITHAKSIGKPVEYIDETGAAHEFNQF